MIKTELELMAELIVKAEDEEQDQLLSEVFEEGYSFDEINEAMANVETN